ncbi:MAG: hypothetical protein A2607_00655 [Candidatus Vogelbacteria bacterium RIFOXYD1_FULL_42_15]|uniref:Uncharacterized protein n=1 Tax=Candidatus Vogelbacteria bacterium RIFOXYD1_FULL_42_15 TaxID=1802437 RepID=A0A1G2QBT1_9BACT|nr:MAG: hypothetical protein A2607_00655 [Candidatus Vogelbacteria bacterium RIFOXYD1_FULL_42_15]
MGIQVEFNPDLALRDIKEYKSGKRKLAECLPTTLKKGKINNFLKKGQRNYWLFGELPLLETKGHGNLSLPLASIKIIEYTHVLISGEVWTKGKYKIIEIIYKEEIRFNGFAKIK